MFFKCIEMQSGRVATKPFSLPRVIFLPNHDPFPKVLEVFFLAQCLKFLLTSTKVGKAVIIYSQELPFI